MDNLFETIERIQQKFDKLDKEFAKRESLLNLKVEKITQLLNKLNSIEQRIDTRLESIVSGNSLGDVVPEEKVNEKKSTSNEPLIISDEDDNADPRDDTHYLSLDSADEKHNIFSKLYKSIPCINTCKDYYTPSINKYGLFSLCSKVGLERYRKIFMTVEEQKLYDEFTSLTNPHKDEAVPSEATNLYQLFDETFLGVKFNHINNKYNESNNYVIEKDSLYRS